MVDQHYMAEFFIKLRLEMTNFNNLIVAANRNTTVLSSDSDRICFRLN